MKAAGGGVKLNPPIGVNPINWFDQITGLMMKYKSVYTDVSYTLHDESLHQKIFDEALDLNYGDRIMFGTDFFMTEKNKKEYDTYIDFKKIGRASCRERV